MSAASGIWVLRWQRLRGHRAGMASLVLLALLLLFVLADFPLEAITGIDPNEADLFARFDPPSWAHPLGMDEAGRDVLLRLMVGGQAPFAAGGVSPTSHGQVRASAQPPCRAVRGLTLPRAARAGTDPAVAGAYLHAGQRSRLRAAMN